jgi:hypothetical protein
MENQIYTDLHNTAIYEINCDKISNLIEKYNAIYYYSSLKLLPTSTSITITGLYPCSYDFAHNIIPNTYLYNTLNIYDPHMYDNEYYKLNVNDHVCPMVVITDTQAFRVKPIFWQALLELYEIETHHKFLPVTLELTDYYINNEMLVCNWLHGLIEKSRHANIAINLDL